MIKHFLFLFEQVMTVGEVLLREFSTGLARFTCGLAHDFTDVGECLRDSQFAAFCFRHPLSAESSLSVAATSTIELAQYLEHL